jgi:serine protease AprX
MKTFTKKNSRVDIALYDLTGKKIRSLISTRQEAGIYQVVLKTDDLPSGTYVYKMTGDNIQLSNKIIIRH